MALVGCAVVSCSSSGAEQTTNTTSDQTEPTETTMAQPTTTRPSMTSTSVSPTSLSVLVFHKTSEFRHDSIEAGIQALQELADAQGFEMTATEDASVFTAESLESVDVVVFLNTTGEVLDESQEAAMEEFIRAGEGFVGVHSAADTEYDWEWYGGLVGAYFDSHPDPQEATVEVVEPEHPVVANLPEQFDRIDEWYNFQSQPGSNVTILATLDESTYEGGNMGSPHPIVWAHEYDGGRAVYIGFGHTSETFAEPAMRALLGNAIGWAGGGT
jgi:cytochrome c